VELADRETMETLQQMYAGINWVRHPKEDNR